MTHARAPRIPRTWLHFVGTFGLLACVLLVCVPLTGVPLLGMPAARADDAAPANTAPAAPAPAAPADTAADAWTVDTIAQRLRQDPILVHPSMGMGDSERAHDVLTRAAAGADRPIYVVLAEPPADMVDAKAPAEQAAILLREELGDGVYHVRFLGGGAYNGVWDGSEDFAAPTYQKLRELEQNGPGEYPHATALLEAVLFVRAAADGTQALSDSVLENYANQPWAFPPEPDGDRADAEARGLVAAVATGFGVLLAGGMITAVAAARPLPERPRKRACEPVPESAPTRAAARLAEVRIRLSGLSTEQLGTEPAEAASIALDAADQVLRTGTSSTSSTSRDGTSGDNGDGVRGEDGLDAVGALVLADLANRELDRINDPDAKPYRPCFLNPLHGEAESTISVEGSSIEAPVCDGCRRRRGAFLGVRRRRRWTPYTETSTVWARTGFGSLVGDLAEQVLEDRSVRR